jgi:hypothetical protein
VSLKADLSSEMKMENQPMQLQDLSLSEDPNEHMSLSMMDVPVLLTIAKVNMKHVSSQGLYSV